MTVKLDLNPPTLTCPADVTVTEGQPIVLGTPTVSDSMDPNPAVTNNAPGSYTIGTTTVTWTVTDAAGHASTCAQTVTVNAAPVNRAPVANNDAFTLAHAGTTPVIMPAPGVLSNDTDADGNALRVVGATASTPRTIALNNSGGTVALYADGHFVYTPPSATFSGSRSFTYQASDGEAASNTATVTLTIRGDPAPNGLVAYWRLDESSGLSAFDASGKGWTGTLVNGTQWTAGKRGQALAFDGTNDEMHTGDLPRSSAMTWVFWMNPANISTTRGILDKYTSGANREWRIYLTAGGELRLSIANGSKGYQERNTSKFKPALNVWTHVAVVYNAGAFNVYKNGVLVSTSGNFTSPYTSIQNTITKVRIGLRQAGGEHFSGKLDEVRIYNRALSVAEILALKDY